MLVVGLVLVVVAAALSAYVLQQTSPTNLDGTPPPRQATNAPFITTPDPVVQAMVELADVDEDDVVYDLGCGDGRIVIAAAQATGCEGVGFDIDPERVAEARRNVAIHGLQERVTIKEADVFTVDLSEADAVVMYLLPWMLKQLIPQFDAMPPGRRIVSHDFKISGCKPDQTIEVAALEGNPPHRHFVHLWITPLKKGTDEELRGEIIPPAN